METQYVLGFMFSHDLTEVALIRKNKPEWQKGMFNGIGGKIEGDEDACRAMHREFKEETGYSEWAWSHYGVMEGEDFCVQLFASRGDLVLLRTVEEEEVVTIPLINLHTFRTIENLTWLIYLAIDHLIDGRPAFTSIAYP